MTNNKLISIEKFFFSMIILIFAHCIGDYAFQTQFLATFKKFVFICFVHSSIWSGVIMYALISILRFHLLWNYSKDIIFTYNLKRLLFWIFIFLLITHMIIDTAKATGQFNLFFGKSPTDMDFNLGLALWLDQGLHFITMLFSYYIIGKFLPKSAKVKEATKVATQKYIILKTKES